LGQSVNGTIDADGPRCFPNWDATARCLQYEVKVPTEGTLVATLTVSGPSRGTYNSEVFLVASDGNWFIHDDVWPEQHVSASVLPGDVFRVVVPSYGPFPDAFEVRADARP
jgi:hypothetical protein